MAEKPKVLEADPMKVPIGHGLYACHLLEACKIIRAAETVVLDAEPTESRTEAIDKINFLLDCFEACLHNAGGAYFEETGDGRIL